VTGLDAGRFPPEGNGSSADEVDEKPSREEIMLVELSVIPLGGNTHLSTPIAEVLKLIDASGIRYQLTPSGTCIEGEWDEVMPVVRLCHERMRGLSSHSSPRFGSRTRKANTTS
jgi:uncharacterized protein (TIGR00106 family)